MILQFTDIYDKVRILSSYEAARIKDAQGESLYEEVLVTEQDTERIRQLAREACIAIHAAARYAFHDVAYDDESSTLVFEVSNAMDATSSSLQVAQEVVATYIMQHWLEDKSPERSKSYEQVFANMLASLVRLAYRKHQPKLEDYGD